MCGVRLKGSDGTKLEGQVQLHDAAPKFACDELYRSTRAHAHTHTQVLFSGSVSSSAEKFLLKLSPTGNWLTGGDKKTRSTDPAEDKHGICLPVV